MASVTAAIPYNKTVRFFLVLNLYHEMNLNEITPKMAQAATELTAKTKCDKNPVLLLKSTNNSTANKEN
jgi:hypothetical protein